MGATLKNWMLTSIFLEFIDLKGQNTSESPGKGSLVRPVLFLE
jgi:hypothetical protein